VYSVGGQCLVRIQRDQNALSEDMPRMLDEDALSIRFIEGRRVIDHKERTWRAPDLLDGIVRRVLIGNYDVIGPL